MLTPRRSHGTRFASGQRRPALLPFPSASASSRLAARSAPAFAVRPRSAPAVRARWPSCWPALLYRSVQTCSVSLHLGTSGRVLGLADCRSSGGRRLSVVGAWPCGLGWVEALLVRSAWRLFGSGGLPQPPVPPFPTLGVVPGGPLGQHPPAAHSLAAAAPWASAWCPDSQGRLEDRGPGLVSR